MTSRESHAGDLSTLRDRTARCREPLRAREVRWDCGGTIPPAPAGSLARAGGTATRRARWALGAATLLLMSAACSDDASKPLPENTPPTTYLSVQGQLADTLFYRLPLAWWGADRDGRVVGYYIRWSEPWEPPAGAPRWAADTSWIYTEATSDTFAAPLRQTDPGALQAVWTDTFSVRAVDDLGLVDPAGRSQIFTVNNWVPTLEWERTMQRPSSSLPAVAFAWKPADLDGRRSILHFRYWLDGEDSLRTPTTTDTVIGLFREDFGECYGPRTLSVQAVDEALCRSNIIRHRWNVEEPHGSWLLIDHVASNMSDANLADPYWRALMDSLAGGDYYVYDVQQKGAFRSALEVFPLFSLFRGVVWYSGNPHSANDALMRVNLRRAHRGIARYLEAGHPVLIAAREAATPAGGLTASFLQDTLGIRDYFTLASGADLGLMARDSIFCGFGEPRDSVVVTDFLILDPDFLQLEGDVTPLYWVRPGRLTRFGLIEPDQSNEPAYLGVLSTRAGGRLAMVSFLPVRTNFLGNGRRSGAALLRLTLGEPPPR